MGFQHWQCHLGNRLECTRFKQWRMGYGRSPQSFWGWLLIGLCAFGIIAWGLGRGAVAITPAAESALPLHHPLHHIVLIDYRDNVTPEEAAAIAADARTSLREIPGILSLELGPQARADRDVHVHDYDWAMHVKFAQSSDLDLYGPHPQHQAFLARHRDRWERIQVIDFYGE